MCESRVPTHQSEERSRRREQNRSKQVKAGRGFQQAPVSHGRVRPKPGNIYLRRVYIRDHVLHVMHRQAGGWVSTRRSRALDKNFKLWLSPAIHHSHNQHTEGKLPTAHCKLQTAWVVFPSPLSEARVPQYPYTPTHWKCPVLPRRIIVMIKDPFLLFLLLLL